MNALAKKPAMVLGTTAMLALGATGLSGITAQARSSSSQTTSSQVRQGPGIDTAALAAKLGVSQTDLETALVAVRTELGAPDRASDLKAEAQAIADSLGVDVSTITTVLQAQVGQRAKDAASGTTPPADSVRPTTPPADAGKRPGRGDRGKRGPNPAKLIAAIVKATGKTEAEVKTALAAGRTAHEQLEAQRQAKFAELLASKLGLQTAAVTAALDAVKPARPAQAAKATAGATS